MPSFRFCAEVFHLVWLSWEGQGKGQCALGCLFFLFFLGGGGEY